MSGALVNKIKKEFAIVDIETTGGHARTSRITEIAIVIHDGEGVVERWESLVDPQQDIPLSIFGLTGIDNDLVADAPIFEDIAEQIYVLLKNRIFVAHNVNFDYSFIRHQLQEAGYTWKAPKLCTVRLSRKIFPGCLSYSLGKLCSTLDIPLSNRHRAGGDADATAILFRLLYEKDEGGLLEAMIKNTSMDQRLPPHLAREEYEKLPAETGVYYFHNQEGKVIYIGKAKNIYSRVGSHFTGNVTSAQRQHFLRDIYHISYELCGSELVALIFECIEIRRLWPKYNRALKKYEPQHGLICYENQLGLYCLAIVKLTKQPSENVAVFHKHEQAVSFLRKLIDRFDLDHRLCSFSNSPIRRQAATDVPPVVDYNDRVLEAISSVKEERKSYVILDRGRNDDEKSCIWVNQGRLHGMGYLSTENPLTDLADVGCSLKRYPSSYYIMQLLESFIDRYPLKVKFIPSQPDSSSFSPLVSSDSARLFDEV